MSLELDKLFEYHNNTSNIFEIPGELRRFGTIFAMTMAYILIFVEFFTLLIQTIKPKFLGEEYTRDRKGAYYVA